jgi:hypothetical protein
VQVIDASSIVHAWDNYPFDQFPPFWEWIEDDCKNGDICIPQPAMSEVEHVSPDCAAWLKAAGIKVLPVTNEVLIEATRLKNALGIQNDKFHADGVDESDLLIVATARSVACRLISNESAQPSLPVDKRRYKIPAVCSKYAPPPCINLLEHIKQSGRMFGANRA